MAADGNPKAFGLFICLMLLPFMRTWFIGPIKLFEFIIMCSVFSLFVVHLFSLRHIYMFLAIRFKLKIASSTADDVTNAVASSEYS